MFYRTYGINCVFDGAACHLQPRVTGAAYSVYVYVYHIYVFICDVWVYLIVCACARGFNVRVYACVAVIYL